MTYFSRQYYFVAGASNSGADPLNTTPPPNAPRTVQINAPAQSSSYYFEEGDIWVLMIVAASHYYYPNSTAPTITQTGNTFTTGWTLIGDIVQSSQRVMAYYRLASPSDHGKTATWEVQLEPGDFHIAYSCYGFPHLGSTTPNIVNASVHQSVEPPSGTVQNNQAFDGMTYSIPNGVRECGLFHSHQWINFDGSNRSDLTNGRSEPLWSRYQGSSSTAPLPFSAEDVPDERMLTWRIGNYYSNHTANWPISQALVSVQIDERQPLPAVGTAEPGCLWAASSDNKGIVIIEPESGVPYSAITTQSGTHPTGGYTYGSDPASVREEGAHFWLLDWNMGDYLRKMDLDGSEVDLFDLDPYTNSLYSIDYMTGDGSNFYISYDPGFSGDYQYVLKKIGISSQTEMWSTLLRDGNYSSPSPGPLTHALGKTWVLMQNSSSSVPVLRMYNESTGVFERSVFLGKLWDESTGYAGVIGYAMAAAIDGRYIWVIDYWDSATVILHRLNLDGTWVDEQLVDSSFMMLQTINGADWGPCYSPPTYSGGGSGGASTGLRIYPANTHF